MKKWIYSMLVFAAVAVPGFASSASGEKSLIDYFLPMEPQGPLVWDGIWGATNVLPRDIKNGIEDPAMKTWCYWDGSIVKDDIGLYHLYCSGWDQTNSHSKGWHYASKGMHAVSDKAIGPYTNTGLAWPQWQEGIGHNVVGLRMHDGRYAMVTSEITDGEVFVSDHPDGPFEHLGTIQVDYNGFKEGLARYNKGTRHMSNVQILLRPDGRYMIVPRSASILISDNGILGPYKIVTERIYKDLPGIPQADMEDPTVWTSGGMYHMVVNHHGEDTAYHFSSKDGITGWKYRGIAFRKDGSIFKYTDGIVNQWGIVQRMTVYVENGHPFCFLFSVIDVLKGQDGPNDENGSKIVVVPFDGVAFDRDMKKRVEAETGE